MSGQEFRETIARWVDERLAPQAEALSRRSGSSLVNGASLI